MKFRYDYYKVLVPVDLHEDKRAIAQQAIVEAEEKTRIYSIPSVWTAQCRKVIGFDWLVSVRRKRFNIRESRPVYFPRHD